MIDTHSLALTTIVKEFDLQVVHAATDFESVRITVEDISRPGIQLSGYFDHFDPVRLQVMGNVEMPILGAAYSVLYHDIPAREAFSALLVRPRKAESEDAGWL